MQVTFLPNGELNIQSESSVEDYAIKMWMRDNSNEMGIICNANLRFSWNNPPITNLDEDIS